jgi:hypothetical protein
MGTLILSLALAVVSAVAGIAVLEVFRLRISVKDWEQTVKGMGEAHKKDLIEAHNEIEAMRTRAILAEKRLRQEGPTSGIPKARSASSIRSMNDRYNEDVIEKEQERLANTSSRV